MVFVVIFIMIVVLIAQSNQNEYKGKNSTSSQMEITQSSDDKNKLPVTVRTDGKVDIHQLSNYSEDKSMNTKVQDNKITIQSIGSYSGAYVEDGTDEQVDNVLAIVVTNTSKEFLQYSEIILSNENEQATFTVSNIPSGASVLVLAKEKTIAAGEWSYLRDTTAFIQSASMYEDIFSWEAGNNLIRLRNKTDNDFENVHVYYKNVENGIYVGGITYRIKLDNVKAQETVQKLSKHFSGNQSHIMMIDYI